MVYCKNKKIFITFLFIFFFPLFSFAFDDKITHPALTEEIVKFYNSFAERKITNEELELMKQGSTLEDTWPRWVNHFYDVFHNAGLNLASIRGASELELSIFLASLPYKPLKSPEWAQNEIIQSKYLNNRTYQRAKRLYFENKNEALITLGHLLHLLEDLGVPDHSRGDSHSGLFEDQKSNYEGYAKYITERYYLTFAQDLIKNKSQPYNFSDIDSFFSSLSKFTGSHWFSEDTIDLRNEFFSEPRFGDLVINRETGLYYLNGKPILLEIKKENDSKNKNSDSNYPIITRTTNDNQIHQAYFNTIVPEIIKYGAGLLNFYFSEIKEMENEETLLLYEKDLGRRVELANYFGFLSNLSSYVLAKVWQGSQVVVNGLATIKEIISPTPPIIKTQYSFEEEKTEKIEKTQEPQPPSQQKQEEITYKEEKKEIIIEKKISENINTTAQTSTSTIMSTPTITSIPATITTSIIRQQKIPTSTETSRPLIYVGGGGGITIQKDKCDEYKNKNYPKLIISEVQFGADVDKDDEFIEIYNPNDQEVDITCWYLEKYSSLSNQTATPSSQTLLPKTKSSGIIKPHGFYLIASKNYSGTTTPDYVYTENYYISKNNSLILKKPNGEISDLVGYGDNAQKIYQYEKSPFTFENNVRKVCVESANVCIYRSIQRKNFQDTDDNSNDFWLHKPSPKNSLITESPRENFIDLTTITIKNFNVFTTSTEDGYFLNISFNEPILTQTHADLTQTSQTNNYSYELLISTSTNFSTFKLEDFGVTSTLPSPKFDGSTTSLSFEITKCPLTQTNYYFALFLKDNLDEENKSSLATSSTTLPEDLCNPEESILVQNISTATTSTGKILFSEIYIKEGTSTGEFIELYNPNEFDINLTGWEIERINKNGTTTINDVINIKATSAIPAFSYFLLMNKNTSTETTTSPDFIYKKSFNLAKDNGLKLIDKEGRIIDQVCWGNVPNPDFQNCPSNPTSTSLSLQRKKTATSTSETIATQNLGNAYSTNNSSNDFLYTTINPENSSITRPTIKDIQNLQISLGKPMITYKDYSYSPDGVLRGPGGACWTCPTYYDGLSGLSYDLKFKWFSPIVYDKENLRYELRFSSSSEVSFQNSFLLTTSTISFLDEQELNLNVYEFYKQTNIIIPSSTVFYLALLDDANNLLKLASTTLNISLPQYNNRLEIPKDNVEYLTEPGYQQTYTQIKFITRYDEELRYISLETGYSEYIPGSTLNLYDSQENLIATTTVEISQHLGWHSACSSQHFYILKLNQPFLLEKNKIYTIKTSNPSLRFQEGCSNYGIRLEGHMF